MKILERKTTNNGYGCSCCASNTEHSNWIEENEMMTPIQLLEEYLSCDICDFHYIDHLYEKDGNVIYGYECKGASKIGEKIVFIFQDKKYLISDYRKNEEIEKTIQELKKILETEKGE